MLAALRDAPTGEIVRCASCGNSNVIVWSAGPITLLRQLEPIRLELAQARRGDEIALELTCALPSCLALVAAYRLAG